MNQLWVRLSLTFTVVIITAMFAIGFIIRLTTGNLLPEEMPPEVQAFLEQNVPDTPPIDVTTIIIVVGSIAIIAGMWMSKNLTTPLNDLEEAAQAIGARELSQRVTVQGTAEIRAVAQRFNEMAEQLEKAEQLRSNLLADVAHELRHPLHILQGNLQAILDGIYPLEKAEIARLLNQTHHLTTLVNDLHELAQAEAHQLPLNQQMVDIAALIKETAITFKPWATEKEITLRIELLGTLPPIQLDPARLRQAFNNLMNNALINTPQQGEIRVQIQQLDGRYTIQVQDTGIGIAPDQLPHLFNRFYRTDNARSRNHGGTGLGLAIVKAIVEAHNGTVTAASPGLGHGATFTMYLPFTPSSPG